MNWLAKLLGRRTGRDGVPVGASDEALADLRRDVQALRLDLREREELIRRLRAELEYLRAGEEARTHAAADSILESLFGDLASPVAQLLVQAHVLAGGGELKAGDVVLVGRQFLTALEDHGLTVLGRVGEEALYDESVHQPLDGAVIEPGARVAVRFPGVGFRGRVLRKAAVQVLQIP